MASSHPYISGPGNIASMINHLRNSFPQTVNSETVKKLGLAPNNESYVINALQFVGVLDQDSKKTKKAGEVFSLHSDDDFHQSFQSMVKPAYSDLFDIYGDGAWTLSKDDLTTFFRQSDQTSAVIGGRQVSTFRVFAALCGFGEISVKSTESNNHSKSVNSKTTAKPKGQKSVTKPRSSANKSVSFEGINGEFGLSVKVEINLPSDASAETYDDIFKSIRKHLINA